MTIKTLNLGWETTLLRYFLMMFLVITGVLTQMWFIAFLALPVFFTAILGISFGEKKKARAKTSEIKAKMIQLGKTNKKVS